MASSRLLQSEPSIYVNRIDVPVGSKAIDGVRRLNRVQ